MEKPGNGNRKLQVEREKLVNPCNFYLAWTQRAKAAKDGEYQITIILLYV